MIFKHTFLKWWHEEGSKAPEGEWVDLETHAHNVCLKFAEHLDSKSLLEEREKDLVRFLNHYRDNHDLYRREDEETIAKCYIDHLKSKENENKK